MTLDEFREEYNFAPITQAELAELIIEHLEQDGEVSSSLIEASNAYLEALAGFESALIEANIELG